MLSLRPNCEHCNIDLAANSQSAKVCSFECTFCRHCADVLLKNCCPNCGGGFQFRPIRPAVDLKNGNYLANHPAQIERIHKPVDLIAHQRFVEKISNIKNDSEEDLSDI